MSIIIFAITTFSRDHRKNVLVEEGMPWDYLPEIKTITQNSAIVIDSHRAKQLIGVPFGRFQPFVMLQPQESEGRNLGFMRIIHHPDEVFILSKRISVVIVGGESLYQRFINEIQMSMMYFIRIQKPECITPGHFPEFSREDWEMNRYVSRHGATLEQWVRKTNS